MKNTTYFLFFCFIGLFFATCKVPSFIEKKMVVFDTGFPVDFHSYGTWYDKKHKKEYIYFGSGADSARIRFFTLDGQRQSEIQDIPLLTNRGVEDVMDIGTIFVYDIDTVVVVDADDYTNQMLYLNKKGERIHKIDFDTAFGTDKERYRVLYCANNTPNKPFLYLSCFWNWRNPRDSSFIGEFENELEYDKVYYKQQYDVPSVCKFDVRTNSYTFTETKMIPNYFLPNGDTSLIFKANTLILGDMLESCYDHKLFIWLNESNKVLVLNPDNLRVEHTFEVGSNYVTVGAQPFPLSLRDKIKMRDEDFYEKGRICKVLYDKKRDLYYVVTRHKIPYEDFAFLTEASFSIHIYDAKLKKLSEQYFEGGKYDYRFIFLTSQGLFIAQNENNKDYDPTKCKFFLFEIKQ